VGGVGYYIRAWTKQGYGTFIRWGLSLSEYGPNLNSRF